MPKQRLILLDAMNFIFRAYHQPQTQGFKTKDGLPTGCVLVFHNMLKKLIEDKRPDYLAAVFDTSGPTFRDELFVEYKANRAAMPDDLARQLPYIRQLLEAMRIPVVEKSGFEADDVIATLAAAGVKQSVETMVVSGDKDMRQMVRPGIAIYDPMKNVLYDAAKVEEVMGVRPEQVVDLLALQGDAVDNVPGAPGIGAKGALQLIQKFGTVEAALERAGEVERKAYRDSLQNHREQILQSKKLVTLDAAAPVPLDLDSLRLRDSDRAAMRALYQKMEFHSLLKDYLPALESGPRDYAPYAGDGLGGGGETVAVAAAGYDAEAAIAFSPRAGVARTIPADRLPELRAFLEDPQRPKAVHDAKATLLALRRRGAELAGVAHDTMLYAYLLDPTQTSYDLEKLAERDFEARLSGELAERADVIGQLAARLPARIDEAKLGTLYREIELPLSTVLADMETTGVLLDIPMLERLSAEAGRQIDALTAEIYKLCGMEFNINSPQQLGQVLFEKLNLPAPMRRGKGKAVSTAADVLEELAGSFDVPRKILEYRQLTKLRGTYMDALPAQADENGRLHTSFEQAGTATGRLSSRDPNLQNIPIRTETGREIRAAFIAPPGWKILSADYSQIELRLLAHFSGDKVLIEAFRKGEDIHARTAELVFGVSPLLQTGEHRRAAKAINFGIVYGLSAFGLAQQLGIPKGEAQKFIDEYFARYPGVTAWLTTCLDDARRDKMVRTLFGRRRPIPDLDSRNPNLRGFAERTAANTPLQGSASDLIKLAMVRLHSELKRRGLAARMILQVHDELVLEAPDQEADEVSRLTKSTMEGAMPLAVPLVVEVGVGPNWRDAK